MLEAKSLELEMRLDASDKRQVPRPAPNPHNSDEDYNNPQLRPGQCRRALFSTRSNKSHGLLPAHVITPPYAHVSSHYNVKASDVPKFNAQVGEDVDLWISQVSAIYSQAGCSEDDLLQSLPSLLRGRQQSGLPPCLEKSGPTCPLWMGLSEGLIGEQTSSTAHAPSATNESSVTTSFSPAITRISDPFSDAPSQRTVLARLLSMGAG